MPMPRTPPNSVVLAVMWGVLFFALGFWLLTFLDRPIKILGQIIIALGVLAFLGARHLHNRHVKSSSIQVADEQTESTDSLTPPDVATAKVVPTGRWRRSLLTAVAYLLIPIYWEYSSPTFSDQGLGWNFFYWSRTSGWNFISFSWYDVQSFILTVGLALLSIVVLVFAALGYRYKSPPLAFGVMITTFLLLNLSLYGYYLTFTGGGLAIPIDIPILIALLVFSYQSRLEIQQRGPQSQ